MSVDCVRHESESPLTGDFGCFGFALEESKAVPYVIDISVGLPEAALRNPCHATVLRGCPFASGEVLSILGARDDAQVSAAIVKCVSVDVVNLSLVADPKPHQLAMQQEGSAISPALYSANPIQLPTPLLRPCDIGGINESVAGNRAVSPLQWQASGQAVVADDGGRGRRIQAAGLRAVRYRSQRRRATQEGFSARQTGTLNGHRRITPGGVTPPAVTSSAGVSHAHFTTLPDRNVAAAAR